MPLSELLLCRSFETMDRKDLGILTAAAIPAAQNELLLCRLLQTKGRGVVGILANFTAGN